MKSRQSRFHVTVWLFTIVYSILYLARPVAGIASPVDNSTEISPLTFNSTYTNYQKFGEPPIITWRGANDSVGKTGGWRFYAREATLPEAADSSAEQKSQSQVNESAKPPAGTLPHNGHEVKP